MKLVHANAAGLLLAVMLLSVPVTTRAQGSAEPNVRTYGTASTTYHTLQAFAFTAFTSFGSHLFNDHRSRYCTGTNFCSFEAPLFLPSGAQIQAVVLDECHGDGVVGVTLYRIGVGESSRTLLVDGFSGGGPGLCGFFMLFLLSPETVDNEHYSYVVEVNLQSNVQNMVSLDVQTRFQAVRVRYQLQAHPAPAVATFADVPTNHLFFQFIEALAAAGITGGCQSPGNPPIYCPNDPVTRGQMAVFISRALGLHFAP